MWRLLVQQKVRPAVHPTPVEVGSPGTVLSAQHGLDVQTIVPFADAVGLTEDLDESLPTDPTDEDHSSGGDGQWLSRNLPTRRQFLQALPTAVLGRRPAPPTRVDLLCIEGFVQAWHCAGQ